MRFFILLLLILTQFFACSIDIAGSKGGSETTNGVVACIVNSNGVPAAGSTVRLRRADYISESAALAKKVKYSDSTDFVTNDSGKFFIPNIMPGSYCIEVHDTTDPLTGGAVLFSFTLNNNDTIDLGTDSLRPFAVLSGYVDSTLSSNKQLLAQIRGLERLVKVNSNGSFSFDDLPEGFFNVVITEAASYEISREIFNVEAPSDDTTTVTVSGSYTYCGYMYLDNLAASIPASTMLTNYPLLIRLHSSWFDFNQATALGDDICFFKKDNSPFSHEIEQWDPISGSAAIWVKVDTISGRSNNQFIIMKWGDPDAVNLSNGASVFDTADGFAGVWHLNENPSLGANSIKDRTLNRFDGTPGNSMTSANIASGIIGNGLWFNGIDDSIDAGQLNLNGNYTLSCWVKAEDGECSNWRFIIKEPAYTLWYDTEWGGFRAEHFVRNYFDWRGIYQDTPDSVPLPMSLDTWFYVVSTYDGDKIRLYINGEQVDSTQTIEQNPLDSEFPLLFGGRNEDEFFKGILDEIRIEKTARSAEWIRFCYINQKPEGATPGLTTD